ncbi:MAG: AAA family ATPase [Ardenticatenaceae bacterium]
MKIHHIRLKNYRQYRDLKIDFSTMPGQNLTIIQGNNGTGKSNLLNAITWCLYGEERHIRKEDRGLPIVNEKVYHALEIGKVTGVEVEMVLSEGQTEYRVIRRAEVARRLDDEVAIRDNLSAEVTFFVRGEWRRSPQPSYTINCLLPAEISHFFFFDGEQLDQFFAGNSAQQVKMGVINVSQIDLLENVIHRLGEIQKGIRRKVKDISPELEKIGQQIETQENALHETRVRLTELQETGSALDIKIKDAAQRLRKSKIEEVRLLQQQRDELEKREQEYESELEGLQAKAAEGLRRVAPPIYGYLAVEKALTLINEQEEKGRLLPEVRPPFFYSLLEQEQCVCGQALHAGSQARANIEQRMKGLTTTEGDIRAWREGQYVLKGMIREVKGQVMAQKERDEEIETLTQRIKGVKRQLKENSVQTGQINVQEVEALEQQRRKDEAALQEAVRGIGREEAEIERLDKSLERLKGKLTRALEDNKQQAGLLAKLDLSDDAQALLDGIRQELVSEVRAQIERKTQEYFRQLIWKKGTYERIDINENYQLNLYNVRGMSSLGTLSAGEQQVLALSFMAALGTVSGFDAPVVIDTPIGRISGEPRKNIADSLPNYLSDTQLILLMTDTEYTPEVKARLSGRVGKEYRLEFNESEAQTKVISP